VHGQANYSTAAAEAAGAPAERLERLGDHI